MCYRAKKENFSELCRIWESVFDAQNYMKTGVFENLLVHLDGILEAPPESMPWDAVCYYSRGFLTE